MWPVFFLLLAATPTPTPTPTPPPASAHAPAPLVLVSTLDGAVAAFSPTSPSSRPLWTLRSPHQQQPALASFTGAGWPQLIPGLDGAVYLTRGDAEPGKRARRRQRPRKVVGGLVKSADGRRGYVVSRAERRVVFVDGVTGKVLREKTVDDPGGPSPRAEGRALREGLVVVSFVSHVVQVHSEDSGEIVANATLTHTSAFSITGTECIPPSLPSSSSSALSATTSLTSTRPESQPFTVDVSPTRTSIELRSSRSGQILWSATLPSPIVHVQGLGGVGVRVLGQTPAALAAPNTAVSVRQPMLPQEEWVRRSEEAAMNAENSTDDRPKTTPWTVGLLGALTGAGLVVLVGAVAVRRFGFLRTKAPRRRTRKKKNKQSENAANPEPTQAAKQPEPVQEFLKAPSSNNSSIDPDLPAPRPVAVRDPVTGVISIGRITVSSHIVGYGSHGTVVYEGTLEPEGRRVAVKRLLRQFYDAARKEISMLIELDEASPWVLRYYAMEEDADFIYLALELCEAPLFDKISLGHPPAIPLDEMSRKPLMVPPSTRLALHDIVTGLADLHMNGVVHRDFKPQNILITYPRTCERSGKIRIADVGLALKLEGDRSSYTALASAGAGTVGWRAPEVLAGGRQGKTVDIFSAGCVIAYVLTGGVHPFGVAAYERDANIMAGKVDLSELQSRGVPDALHLVSWMLARDPKSRPSASQVARHPFFWTDSIRLSFLVDVWDRLCEMDRSRGADALDARPGFAQKYGSWPQVLDMAVLRYLLRSYDATCSGLLRCIRNKRSHYAEFPPDVRALVGPLPRDGQGVEYSSSPNYCQYFTSRFPSLVMDIYAFASELEEIRGDPHFERYGLDSEENALVRRLTVSAGADLRRMVSASSSFPQGFSPLVPASSRGAVSARQEHAANDRHAAPQARRRRVYEREDFVGLMHSPLALVGPLNEHFLEVAECAGIADSSAGFRWRRRLRAGKLGTQRDVVHREPG